MKVPKTIIAKITLEEITPPIWRRFETPTGITLHQFHEIIQVVMGWGNSHLYEFKIGGESFLQPDDDYAFESNASSSDAANLGAMLAGGFRRMEYIYDFGDHWSHSIEFEGEGKSGKLTCLAGERACPPDDCGSTPGYENLIKILANKKHKEYKEMRRWAGQWAPEKFNFADINEQLDELITT